MNFSCKHPPTTQITLSSARNVITLPNSVQNYCKTIQHCRAAAAGLVSLMTKSSNDKTRQETSSRPGSQSSTWCLYAGRCEAAIIGQTILYSHCCSASGWEIIKFTTIFHVFSVFIQLMSVIINSFNHKCAVWSSLPLNYFIWTWKLTRPMRKFIDYHKSGLQRCLWWRHLSSMVF